MTNSIDKLVSVIIPAYNHENYIQDTIKSIIEQTYKDIELIVVDDGSKDSTWQKIREMQEQCEKRFVNVIFETKQNEGTCKTLNKLLSLVKGEYVYLIASDDMAKPTAIEKEVNFLENNLDYALCVGDNEFMDSKGQLCYWGRRGKIVYNIHIAKCKSIKNIFKKKIKSLDDFGTYESLVKGNYIPNGYLIRRNIFDKIGNFIPEAPLEDYWLMLQIAKYSKMKFIDEILYSYRQHSNNTIKQKNRMWLMTQKTIFYEKELVKNNKKLYNIWNKYEKKNKLNLLFVKFYKIDDLDNKKYYISLFGKSFLIKTKYIKPE